MSLNSLTGDEGDPDKYVLRCGQCPLRFVSGLKREAVQTRKEHAAETGHNITFLRFPVFKPGSKRGKDREGVGKFVCDDCGKFSPRYKVGEKLFCGQCFRKWKQVAKAMKPDEGTAGAANPSPMSATKERGDEGQGGERP